MAADKRIIKPSYIVIHHSAGKDGVALDVPAIRKQHVKINGWTAIGYHMLLDKVDDTYEIVTGRMLNEVGAHCSEQGMNTKGIGVCCIGNYETSMPEPAMLDTLRRLVKSLMWTFDIPKINVLGHGNIKATLCPGKNLSIEKFREFL